MVTIPKLAMRGNLLDIVENGKIAGAVHPIKVEQ
jgi:hypothetical protein